MSWLSERFCSLFRTTAKGKIEPATEDGLRDLLKTRYWNFKQLLDLNRRSLEIVAGMEHQLKAGQGYGMSYIRSRATSLSVCVYQIIEKLEGLAPPGRYAGLHQAFAEVRERITKELESHGEHRAGPLVVDLEDVGSDDADWAGSKMAVLGEIANRLRLPVPDGFVLSSAAYQSFIGRNRLQERINQQLQSAPMDDLELLYEVSRDIQELIISADLPDELRRSLDQFLEDMERRHGQEVLLSMRSSALGEDGLHLSYAGQYRTELNVTLGEAPEAYKRVLAGKYSARAIAYRHSHGVRDEDILMSVGCMRMIEAETSGVVYSRDPSNPRADRVFINAAPGLGSQVVDGVVSPQSYLLGREKGSWTILRTDDDGPSAAFPLNTPELKPARAAELAELSRVLEEYFGTVQDVEWTMDRHQGIVILQSRPLRIIGPRPKVPERVVQVSGLPEPLLVAGVCASTGIACGPARLVTSREDALLVQPGDVLVVENALPQWAVLLEKVAAVVADHGGIASHLATVAREFGIPALFNTLGATRTIPSGGLVTVDADGGRIYDDRVDPLLDTVAAVKPRLMMNSPIHASLERVLRSITPLNLVSPEDPGFAPDHCRTYHDIIRFCHEKAVVEMFALGQDSGFQAQAGKQLKTDIPMQWWIVDLGEGVAEGVPQPVVLLSELLSRPFLAVWEGIVAVPWQGPPSPNLGGFFSAMANSTMNTDLEVCMPSVMQQKNCAFVSRHFCSLNCRFGYHFSVIQAFVGERSRENYIRFSFQGGATDRSRKAGRLELIRKVLEEAGFQLDIKEDTLTARIEGYDAEHLLKRLKALGYLIVHTRQIDMIMNDHGRASSCLEMLRGHVRDFIDPQESSKPGDNR
jgi:pyruvate, water dikinase